MLVLDPGHITIRSELQPIKASLEDATQMELEERMYDRLHVEISESQVLFCDCGTYTDLCSQSILKVEFPASYVRPWIYRSMPFET